MSDSQPSRIILNTDRSITVVLEQDRRVELRPPSIGEFRKIRNIYKIADVEFKAILNEADRAAKDAGEDLLIVDADRALVGDESSPYAAAFAFTLELLGGIVAPDPDTLPMWAGRAGMYPVLANHWRSVNVVPVNEAAAPPTEAEFNPHFPGPVDEPAVAEEPPVRWPEAEPPPPPAEANGMRPGPVAARG